MNLEILFRGKSVLTGEWIISSTRLCYDDGSIGLVHLKRGISAVDPATVGQYTGLTDAKGEKIFDGDVIHNKHDPKNVNYVVEWYDGGFVYRDVKIRAFGSNLTQSDANEVEIVGNIHDNPELLHSYGTMRKE